MFIKVIKVVLKYPENRVYIKVIKVVLKSPENRLYVYQCHKTAIKVSIKLGICL